MSEPDYNQMSGREVNDETKPSAGDAALAVAREERWEPSLAREYGVYQTAISKIITRKKWKQLH